MAESGIRELIIENRHSGERLAMRRVKRGDEVWLELKGLLPAHRQGPPLHVHVAEDEEGVVRSGTLSAALNGRQFTVGSGERVSLPRGSTHRWWNDGNELLVFEGYARPAVDLDRFLQAIFDILNAGTAGRPPLFYMPSPLEASSYADRSHHAAADPSGAVSSDRHGWHPAWALSRGW